MSIPLAYNGYKLLQRAFQAALQSSTRANSCALCSGHLPPCTHVKSQPHSSICLTVGSGSCGTSMQLSHSTAVCCVHLRRTVWSSGVFCVLCAAFIFAIAALLVKLTGGRVPVLQITLIRSAMSLVVSAGECILARGMLKGTNLQQHQQQWVQLQQCQPHTLEGSCAVSSSCAARTKVSTLCLVCPAPLIRCALGPSMPQHAGCWVFRCLMEWCIVLLLVCPAALIKGKGITPVMGHRQNIKWLIPRGVFGEPHNPDSLTGNMLMVNVQCILRCMQTVHSLKLGRLHGLPAAAFRHTCWGHP